MKRIFVCLCASLLLSMPSFASINDPFNYFNLYSSGNIGTATQGYGSDCQGTVGAAGNAYFSNYSANGVARNPYGLHAGGNVTLSGGSYYNNVDLGGNLTIQSLNITGNVYAGGNVTGTWGGTINGDVNAGGSINFSPSVTAFGTKNAGQPYNPVVDFGNVTDYFSNVSSYYAHQADTTSYINYYGNIQITLSSGMNIVTMNASEFNNAWGLTVGGANDGALIINLVGEEVSLNSTNLNGIDKSKVLLNYYEAYDLSLSGGNTLNLLAINADTIFNNGHIDGNLIVGNLAGSGQVNIGSFDPGVEVVPEPTTMLLLGIGALMLKKRKAIQ